MSLSQITQINTSPSIKANTLDTLSWIELDSTDQGETHQANSITLKKMMSKTVTSDTFDLP